MHETLSQHARIYLSLSIIKVIIMKKALISGISGQDGSYLAELLLEKGYEVHGMIRRSSSFNTFRIDHLYNNKDLLNQKFFLHYGDLTDSSNLNRLLEKIAPEEIYNLGAQSHVQVSFEVPEYTAEVDGIGTLRFLDAIKESQVRTRFYQASTSELFGKAQDVPQNEQTPFYPRSPYGVAKLYAFWTVVNYREAYGLFACNGILFNHESERRGKTFVTRKISVGVSNIMTGQQEVLLLGNLDAQRDWGYAPEYVEGMWRILQTDTPEDFVLATGEKHTVRDFVEESFKVLGEDILWEGKGVREVGILKSSGRVVVQINPRYFRPSEVDILIGDASKAKEKLGWDPTIKFQELVRIMVLSDYEKALNRKKYGNIK